MKVSYISPDFVRFSFHFVAKVFRVHCQNCVLSFQTNTFGNLFCGRIFFPFGRNSLREFSTFLSKRPCHFVKSTFFVDRGIFWEASSWKIVYFYLCFLTLVEDFSHFLELFLLGCQYCHQNFSRHPGRNSRQVCQMWISNAQDVF